MQLLICCSKVAPGSHPFHLVFQRRRNCALQVPLGNLSAIRISGMTNDFIVKQSWTNGAPDTRITPSFLGNTSGLRGSIFLSFHSIPMEAHKTATLTPAFHIFLYLFDERRNVGLHLPYVFYHSAKSKVLHLITPLCFLLTGTSLH